MKLTTRAAGALYTAGIHLYQGALRLAALRVDKAADMLRGRRDTIAALRALPQQGPRVWLHAASLGEFEQGRPLMEWLRRERPDTRIILSFYSPSGYRVRRDWPGADAVVYLPADTPRAARAFIDTLQPDMAIFVKYEFWANFLFALRDRQIPIYLISGIFRSGQPFFRPWGGLWREMLRCFTRLYVQDEASRRLLASAGTDSVTVAGDTRFDRVTDIMRGVRPIAALDRFCASPQKLTLIFGSSWPADEAVYIPWLKSRRERLHVIIAPHEFNPARLDTLERQLAPELKAVRYSHIKDDPALADGADCLIMDCFGLLSSAYRYARVAYIGGGFGAGIHNINEAAVYGIPVVFGPKNEKFIEARELKEAGGGFPVGGREDYESVMERLLDSGLREKAGHAAGAYIASKLGATGIISADLFPQAEKKRSSCK